MLGRNLEVCISWLELPIEARLRLMVVVMVEIGLADVVYRKAETDVQLR